MDIHRPVLAIHCAGYVNALKAEYERALCWNVNFQGTRNIAKASHGARFAHISTDYVFDGLAGDYAEDDIPHPINEYGRSKFAAEEAVLIDHPSALILRVPFRYGPPWPYVAAFTDQWTSARFITEVVPDILRAVTMNITGVLHIGGPRRCIHDMAYEVSHAVGKLLREDVLVPLPRDVSLNSTLWHSL